MADAEQPPQCVETVAEVADVRRRPLRCLGLVADHRIDQHAGVAPGRAGGIVVGRAQHKGGSRIERMFGKRKQ